MAFLADEKSYVREYLPNDSRILIFAQKEPVEGLFRAMIMVVMDNATAEYSFIRQFFNRDEPTPVEASTSNAPSIDLGIEESVPGSPVDMKRRDSDAASVRTMQQSAAKRKADDAYFDGIWKQVMEPVLQYSDVSYFYFLRSSSQIIQSFLKSIINPSLLDPKPSVVPILTMIRLNEAAYQEVCRRDCGPMEAFLVGIRMLLWPLFQSEMGAHVDSLKALADSATGSMFARGNIRDPVVRAVHPFLSPCWISTNQHQAAQRYAIMFSSILALIGNEEEPMLFIK